VGFGHGQHQGGRVVGDGDRPGPAGDGGGQQAGTRRGRGVGVEVDEGHAHVLGGGSDELGLGHQPGVQQGGG